MSSINGILPSQGPFYSENPSPFIKEFEKLYEQLLESSPPSKTAVRDLLTFIKKNHEALVKLGQEIDYPPYPGASMKNDLTALTTALSAYLKGAHNEGAVFEFAGNIRVWFGIGVTPEDIYKAFRSALLFFEQDPSKFSARNLDLFLQSHGYLSALSQFAHDPAKFMQDADKAEKLLQAYEASPSPETEKAAEQAIQTLQGDL